MLATITAHTTTPFLLLPPPPPLLLLLPLQLVLLLPPPPRRYHHYQCNFRLQLLPLPLLLLLLTLTARPLQVLLPLLLDLRISSAPKHSESSCGPTKDYMPISFKNEKACYTPNAQPRNASHPNESWHSLELTLLQSPGILWKPYIPKYLQLQYL